MPDKESNSEREEGGRSLTDALKYAQVSGMLIGVGGADGINVATVNRVAETCP